MLEKCFTPRESSSGKPNGAFTESDNILSSREDVETDVTQTERILYLFYYPHSGGILGHVSPSGVVFISKIIIILLLYLIVIILIPKLGYISIQLVFFFTHIFFVSNRYHIP